MYEQEMWDLISTASYPASYLEGTSPLSTQRTSTGRDHLHRPKAKTKVTNIGIGLRQDACGMCLAGGRKTVGLDSFPDTTLFAPIN
jgi:hypothetical protein